MKLIIIQLIRFHAEIPVNGYQRTKGSDYHPEYKHRNHDNYHHSRRYNRQQIRLVFYQSIRKPD